MKQLFAFAFSALLCSSALLYGETSDRDARRIFLKQERVGGFVPPSMQGYKDELRVYKNGRITHYTKKNASANPKEEELGQLNIFVLRKIQSDLNKYNFSELVTDESQPRCTDVPSTYYSSPLLGKKFAETRSCRTYLPNGDAYMLAHNLMLLLNGLSVLEREADGELLF